MIIQIKSQNPHLLDILYKNPNTDEGLYLKPLKNGVVVGNVISENQYDVIFQDTKYSYLPEDSNAIDFQSYASPLVVLDISAELFAHLLRERDTVANMDISWLNKNIAELDQMPCTIIVKSFYIHSGWVKANDYLLSKYLKQVSVQQKVGYNYELRIEADSVVEAINLLNLVSVFAHITNRYGVWTYIDDHFAQKYARILTNIPQVPYFVFYLFIKRAIKSPQQFESIKERFEAYLEKEGLEVSLTRLPTHQARIAYITDRLDRNMATVDIGCGELMYYKKMIRRAYFKAYHAIDNDPDIAQLVARYKEDHPSKNLHFYTSLDQLAIDEPCNVIISEVIEHNGKEEAVALIKQACQLPFEQIIITTPNVEFNKYYSEELASRHEGHVFEPTRQEFVALLEEAVDKDQYLIQYDGIGDTINGIQPTQAAIITKKVV